MELQVVLEDILQVVVDVLGQYLILDQEEQEEMVEVL
jgi:hypothetical protein